MPFQKCPVCNGSGVVHLPLFPTTNAVHPPCKTCSGARIINELTGLPPYTVNTDVARDLTDEQQKALDDFNCNGGNIVPYSRNTSKSSHTGTDFRDFPMEQQLDK